MIVCRISLCDEKSDEKSPTTYEAKPLAFALSMVLSLLMWLLLGPSLSRLLRPLGIPYLTANAPFLAMAGGFLASKQILLKQPLKSLLTDHPVFQTSLFIKSFLIYFLSATAFLLVDVLLNPHYYQPMTGSSPSTYLLMLPLVLLLTPLQTSAEELVLRMLPVRAINKGRLSRDSRLQLVTSLVSALLFAVPHLGNRELAIASNRLVVVLYYALFGFVVTYLCLKHRGFSAARDKQADRNRIRPPPAVHQPSLGSITYQKPKRKLTTNHSYGMVQTMYFRTKESLCAANPPY